MGSITHVITEKPVVALTFDDGPHPVYTLHLLRILEKYRAHATFFMVGQAASKYPDIVQQVAKAGHSIGNHTWSHLALPSINRKDRWGQLRRCKRALAPYGSRFFRPPYGEQTPGTHLDAFCFGYEVVAFNIEVGDWWDPDPRRMVDSAISGIKPGGIVVFHDSIFDEGKPKHGIKLPFEAMVDRKPMLVTLELLLKEFSGRFRFVTIPELLKFGRPHRENWYLKIPVGVQVPH
jgi:peptidoglycan/xylan/chitin deacetylase (PgdA/CDA1 family)